VGEDRHPGDSEHLREGEEPGAEIILAVQVVVDAAIQPGHPDQHKEENRPLWRNYCHRPAFGGSGTIIIRSHPMHHSYSLGASLAAIQVALIDRPTESSYLSSCGSELQSRLLSLSHDSPAYGLIHGDVIRANALVQPDGNVTVIDFDWYGPGWRAYDIASYLLTIHGDPNEQSYAEAFLSGYDSVRALAADEYKLLPLFEAVRAVLEIGTPAQHVNEWGSAYLYSFFDQSLQRFKQSMEQLA
jgi:hypothetical protein